MELPDLSVGNVCRWTRAPRGTDIPQLRPLLPLVLTSYHSRSDFSGCTTSIYFFFFGDRDFRRCCTPMSDRIFRQFVVGVVIMVTFSTIEVEGKESPREIVTSFGGGHIIYWWSISLQYQHPYSWKRRWKLSNWSLCLTIIPCAFGWDAQPWVPIM